MSETYANSSKKRKTYDRIETLLGSKLRSDAGDATPCELVARESMLL